jgi:hypothetical protein
MEFDRVRETLRAHIDSPGDDSTTFYDAPPEWRFTLRDGRGKIRVTLSRYHRDTGEMYFTCQEHGKPSYDHQSSSALEATLMRLADPEVHNTYKHIVDWLLCPSQSPRVAIAREDAAVEVARSAARLAGHDWDQDRVNERSASLAQVRSDLAQLGRRLSQRLLSRGGRQCRSLLCRT